MMYSMALVGDASQFGPLTPIKSSKPLMSPKREFRIQIQVRLAATTGTGTGKKNIVRLTDKNLTFKLSS